MINQNHFNKLGKNFCKHYFHFDKKTFTAKKIKILVVIFVREKLPLILVILRY